MISIIIPVYNEEKTVLEVLESIREAFSDTAYEIIIVDDGSKDGTELICENICIKYDNVKYIRLPHNRGKGFALREGVKEMSGFVAAIQDADLEYNPKVLRKLYREIENGQTNNIVIYGKRDGKEGYVLNRLANKFLSSFCNLLYGSNLQDIYTCYKLIPLVTLKSLELSSNGFEVEAEITAKLLLKKIKIIEIPITYYPRSFKDGKHMRAKDGLKGVWTLIKNRF